MPETRTFFEPERMSQQPDYYNQQGFFPKLAEAIRQWRNFLKYNQVYGKYNVPEERRDYPPRYREVVDPIGELGFEGIMRTSNWLEAIRETFKTYQQLLQRYNREYGIGKYQREREQKLDRMGEPGGSLYQSEFEKMK